MKRTITEIADAVEAAERTELQAKMAAGYDLAGRGPIPSPAVPHRSNSGPVPTPLSRVFSLKVAVSLWPRLP